MKIALVHRTFASGGGMERHVVDLARGFRAFGDSVDVWASKIDPELAAKTGVNAVKVSTLSIPQLISPWTFATAIQREHLRDRYDCVISMTKVTGQHIHVGGTHLAFMKAMGRTAGLKDRITLFCERRTMASAKRFVAQSKMTASDLATYYPEIADRTAIIRPAVDPSAFRTFDRTSRASARERLGLSNELLYFLFPSTGHMRKGLGITIESFRHLADRKVQLLIAGAKPAVSLPPNVKALGFVRDMESLYNAADCTLLPTHHDPFGRVVAESLSCGTPVIVSKFAGAAELVSGDDGIVLPELTKEALTAAILDILGRPRRTQDGYASRNGLTIDDYLGAFRRLIASLGD